MKVDVEDLSSVKRKIHVEVPADVVAAEFDRAYQALRRKVRIKGFRQGKAPRSILERYYGDQVRYEVTTKLIQETYPKSLEEKSLAPITQPSIEEAHVDPGEDFRYTATIEVKPQLEVSDYIGLEVNGEEVRVTEERVQERLDEIREMFAQLEEVTEKRQTQEGDVAVIEHQLLIDGEPVEEEGPREQMVELRPQRVDEEILSALVGLGLGEEARIPQSFPADHPDPKLAGKKGAVRMVLQGIQRKKLPDLNDEFAGRLGEYGSLEELRAKIREDLEESERQRIRSAMNQAILDQLTDRYPMEVPEAMVERQIQEMIRNTQRRLAAQGVTMEQAGADPEQMRSQYMPAATKAVRSSLILEAIARSEGLEITDEELADSYEKIAKSTGRNVEEIRKLYAEPAMLESLKSNLLEEKTLAFLRDHAKIVKETKPKKSRKSRATKSGR